MCVFATKAYLATTLPQMTQITQIIRIHNTATISTNHLKIYL